MFCVQSRMPSFGSENAQCQHRLSFLFTRQREQYLQKFFSSVGGVRLLQSQCFEDSVYFAMNQYSLSLLRVTQNESSERASTSSTTPQSYSQEMNLTSLIIAQTMLSSSGSQARQMLLVRERAALASRGMCRLFQSFGANFQIAWMGTTRICSSFQRFPTPILHRLYLLSQLS